METQVFAYIDGRIYFKLKGTVRFYFMETQQVCPSFIRQENFDKWIKNKVDDNYKIEAGNLTEAIQIIKVLGMESRN